MNGLEEKIKKEEEENNPPDPKKKKNEKDKKEKDKDKDKEPEYVLCDSEYNNLCLLFKFTVEQFFSQNKKKFYYAEFFLRPKLKIDNYV